ncbi:hypothetical protein J2X71_007231 [Rhizobium sp. 1399]|nr:hypothetical protein [Rhizobium sp. 1399]
MSFSRASLMLSAAMRLNSSRLPTWTLRRLEPLRKLRSSRTPISVASSTSRDGQGIGTGAAIKRACKQDQIHYLGGGAQSRCDGLLYGTYSMVINYDVPGMGRDAS